jgi:predicted lysophospholipase L1 biosynthesis ABC-type transport system permease subunit
VNAKPTAILLWAGRENLRRPGANLLLALCLGGLATALALILLISDCLERTSVELLNQGPDLVIRRRDINGWQPIPVADALKALEGLPGIIRARPRVWGLVQSGPLSITVVAANRAMHPERPTESGIAVPDRGRAITGGWWRQQSPKTSLTLSGEREMEFQVDTVLPAAVDLAAFDTIVLNPADARALLGIPEGWASDLALYVFHPGEANALRPEIHEALPWPVTIRTRSEARDWYRSGFGRRSSLIVILWLPAVAGLGLIVLVTIQRQTEARMHAGLLKALGWTMGDIVRLHLFQALIVALPSIMLGLTLAYTLTGGPFTDELARLLLGWQNGAPARSLAPGGSVMVFLNVGVFVLLPYLAAALWPAFKTAATDADTLLNEQQ